MNQTSLHSDDDQDSLFGSPPPSPTRGRSPSQQTLIAGEEAAPVIAVPSTGVCRKNVGTIALPGSHMSCAELPADLPASGLSLSRCASTNHSLGLGPSSIPESSAPGSTSVVSVVASVSSTCSVLSRASSAASTVHSNSIPIQRRRASKAKSLTPAPPPTPPMSLPAPNEPTPPNFLRSQSSLLGLAGLVGCVKPAQLHTHGQQQSPIQSSRSHSPIRGSTPANPIVLDDDQDAPHIGKHPRGQLQMPQRLDQLDPEALRHNIVNSLAKEKNIFPVLESLIKLFGDEPHPSSPDPPPQPFARPYGHVQPSTSLASCIPGSSTMQPLKRRKLKHVPAGAADWDIPFPFAAGEGPHAYRDTWPQDRAKQLVTQLLDLVQKATKRAAVKTARNGGKTCGGEIKTRNNRSSRSASVDTQMGQTVSTQAAIHESLLRADLSLEGDGVEMLKNMGPMDSLAHNLGLSETPSTIGLAAPDFNDTMSSDLKSVAKEGSAVDYPAFEEWLSQLQQFVPFETDAPTPESDCAAPPISVDMTSPSPVQDMVVSNYTALTTPHKIRDEAIDPSLLAISQQAESAPDQPKSSSSTTSIHPFGDSPLALDKSSIPPVLTHSPRTSLSSLTEPITPLSEAYADAPTSIVTNQDLVRDLPADEECRSQPADRARAGTLSPCPTEPSESLRISASQKGKARAVEVVSAMQSESSRSTPSAASVASSSKCTPDRQAILERAKECRRQIVADIERTKKEMLEISIENAVLMHFTRNGS